MNELIEWFSREGRTLPGAVQGILERLLAVYEDLSQGALRAKQTLATLRRAMGFIPKSERGGQEATPAPPPVPKPSASSCSEIDAIMRKRRELMQQKFEYDGRLRVLKGLGPKKISKQLEFDLGKPCEMLFSSPIAIRAEADEERKVDRIEEFGKIKGLHAASDYPKRMKIEVKTTEITYKVETVTDPETGKSVRASTIDDGPPGFQLTWESVGNLVKMHVGFAIPIHRIALMIGQKEFSTSKICRILQYMAAHLVVIYLALADELSDVAILSGDDTVAKVLQIWGTNGSDTICDEIDTRLGWVHAKASGKGDKKALNVSLLVGKSAKDPRSTIRFFRTHVGSVGNLLTKILESRSPKVGPVIFQGDLSSTNLPTNAIREKISLMLAGCGAHARRPFWRYREEDESLCYFMLRGFLKLSEIEAKIDAVGRTRANVLRLRGRYGRLVWLALKNRCTIATTGYSPGPATYPKGITPTIWPPSTELNRAANYVINHFEELTLYLKHPELEYTNNGSERALRVEKCMLSSSKFRKTKRGRVTLDILRTINATCTAAKVDIIDYLRFTFKHASQLHEHPENFTPFAFALAQDQKSAAANANRATMPSA